MALLKAVSLTLVEYEAGDATGKLLAYACLVPVFLIVATAAALLARRELLIVRVACSANWQPTP